MASIDSRNLASFDVGVDVAIVGAGAAGLIAGLAAREAGAESVVILERDAVPAGSTALSAGLIPAPGTRWQREAGIEDDARLFAEDIFHKADNEPDEALVRLVAEAAGPTVEWLADRYGLPFSVISDFSYPGHSRRRMHGLPLRSGQELVDALRDAAEGAGCDILCDSTVETLYRDDVGRMTGLQLARPDRTRETLGAKAIVLACNGYGGNKALLEREIPEMAGAHYFGHEGNRGEAVLWGEALGARLRHLSGHQGHGSVAHPAGILITWAAITEGGFQINRSGERFSNEAKGYSEQAAEVLRQPDATAFDIFDERIAAICRQFEDFRRAEAMNAVVEAGSFAELAARLGVDPERLDATASAVEAMKAGRSNDPFGRDLAGVAPLQAPFKAVRVTGALFHTQGGLVVDEKARVVTQGGAPIPNLFAAGGAACGVSGSKASGYLSGNGLLTAVSLGRIAGQAAARVVGQPA
ncbi:FAD-dependent oxidoreductase [Aureimonas ureilytica]|uniref:FAD-dependent oxidoreductase n=1 Tax=Aureimonas ureilytica TaxID=401562 RepID=UPI00035F909D|nr:FAD-dependent oxidoreductase [Aureimonas ureilytica]